MTKSICGCLMCVEKYRFEYDQKNLECNRPDLLPGNNYSDPDLDAKGYLQDVPPVDQFLNENLHLVWYGHFKKNFVNITNMCGHLWILEPDVSENPVSKIWQSKEMAKVRFICDSCGKTWTSMKGIASFYATKSSHNSNLHILRFKLFGQKCTDCNSPDFQSAIWYPEEVVKVINNVYDKIARQFYNMSTNVDIKNGRFGLRVGRPRRSHISESCQACQAGVCPIKKRKKLSLPTRQHNDSISSESTNLSDQTVDESFEYEKENVSPPALMKQISVQSNVSDRVTLSLASPSHQRSQY